MHVRHRPVHTLPGGPGRLVGPYGHRWRSRRRLVNKDNVGYVAIVAFVLLGLALFLFFDFHHHEYDIDTGKEVDVEKAEEVEANEEAQAAEEPQVEEVVEPAALLKDAVSVEKKKDEPAGGGAAAEADAAAAEEVGALRGGGQPHPPPPEPDAAPKKESGPRFVTVVLPSVVNPSGRTKRLEAIAATWGPAARAVYVVHDTAEYLEGANNLVGFSADGSHHPQLLVVPETIKAEDGVPRLQHTIRAVHEHIGPDFAFFVNDHTFVIPEHLCAFLGRHDPSKELYAGHAMKNEKEGYAFNSGAAGYVLSRHTMGDLVKKWDERDPKCAAEHAAKWLQGNPGLVTAKCLRESMHVNAVDTRDDEGRHRFHAFGLARTVSGRVDEWYLKKHHGLDVIFGPDRHRHQHMPLKGADCCAADTVSFHYVEHAETRALYEVRERLKKSGGTTTDDELKAMMISAWPKGRDLGAYAHELPHVSKAEEWRTMLGVFRRISPPAGDKNPQLPPC